MSETEKDKILAEGICNENLHCNLSNITSHQNDVDLSETSNQNTDELIESIGTVVTGSENQDEVTVDDYEEGNPEALNSSDSKNILKRKKDFTDGPRSKKKKKLGYSSFALKTRWRYMHDISDDLRVKYKMHPYWGVPYGRQLFFKERDTNKFLIRLGNHIEEIYSKPLQILKKFRTENSNQCCPLKPIYRSPVIVAYRNLQNFTIRRHHITKERAVGFAMRIKKDSVAGVYEPDGSVTIPPHMLHAAKHFEKYVRLSECDVYDPLTHKGFWSQLIVRTSNCGDIMLIIGVNYPSLDMQQKEFKSEKRKLKEYYSKDDCSIYGITSIYFKITRKNKTLKENYYLHYVRGKKSLEESLLGMKFEISPDENFYHNVPAAEILCQLVADLVNPSSSTTVLNLHFGAGAINLCLAKTGCKLIGIENNPNAVKNARTNAKINGLSNVTYMCGKVEEAIEIATSICDSMDIVAVVELTKICFCEQIMQSIRTMKNITKVILIFSGLSPSHRFFTELCKPKSEDGEENPFYPIQAAVVDTEPYTVKKKIILVFERYDSLI